MSRAPRLLRSLPVGPRGRGSWAVIRFRMVGRQPRSLLYVVGRDAAGQPVTRDMFPGEAALRDDPTQLLCFLPTNCTTLSLLAVGPDSDAIEVTELVLRPLGRGAALLRLLRAAPRRVLAQWGRGVPLRPGPLLLQLRTLLAEHNEAALTPPQDYATWITLFDHGLPEDVRPAPDWPSIGVVVLAREAGSAALAATLAGLDRQRQPAPRRVLAPGGDVAEAARQLGTDYIGLLQAGEVPPPHATLLASRELARLGRPECAIADEDSIAPDGQRHDPRFKPTPGPVAMLSGILSRGLWLVRRDALLAHAPARADWAEALRMHLWFARYQADAAPFSARIPFILSHRRADAEAAPPAVLAEVAARHLERTGGALRPVATWPLGLALTAEAPTPRVTAIVPSTLRPAHARSCIGQILRDTDYPALDLRVIVMQPGPLDAVQREAAEAIRSHPAATVDTLAAARFNFSTANNHVAARTDGELILLLNDDVSPIRADWLRWMAAFMADPAVGMVGARLLYPGGTVQHGGVVMGMEGLCGHAHRYLPREEPGYMSRAVLAQELSVVTAACMLVRRSLFEQVGGLDEGYPSAFNDVDLALRIGETGHSVIYAPQAELWHHELQTYGSHYAGERKAFEAAEVARLRARWAEVCRADPFHNPNLGLLPGQEWKLAFPPRLGDREG